MLSVDGDADVAVEARIRIGWNKFGQLVPLLTSRDNWLGERGCIAVVCKVVCYTEEKPAVRKENEMALQRAEVRMVRWMCNAEVKDKSSNMELRERLGIDDIILVLQQNRL